MFFILFIDFEYTCNLNLLFLGNFKNLKKNPLKVYNFRKFVYKKHFKYQKFIIENVYEIEIKRINIFKKHVAKEHMAKSATLHAGTARVNATISVEPA